MPVSKTVKNSAKNSETTEVAVAPSMGRDLVFFLSAEMVLKGFKGRKDGPHKSERERRCQTDARGDWDCEGPMLAAFALSMFSLTH